MLGRQSLFTWAFFVYLLCLRGVSGQFITKREFEKNQKSKKGKDPLNKLAELEAELKLEGFAIYKNPEYVNQRGEDGLTKLMVVANRPDQGKAKHLVAQGADTELTDERGDTALLMAVSKGYYYPAAEMLKGHANIHHKNKKGINSLHAAIAGGQLILVETLLSFDFGWRNSRDWAEEYKRKPKLVDEPIATGLTPLMMCAQQGEIKMIEKLLAYGADVNLRKTATGETPLMYAAIGGNAPIVDLLLNEGADPYPYNDLGFTALIMAAHRGHEKVVKLFIDIVDAQPHQHLTLLEERDSFGYSALDHAIDERQQGTIDLLMAAGVGIGAIHPKTSPGVREKRLEALARKEAVAARRPLEEADEDEDEDEDEEEENEYEGEDEGEDEGGEAVGEGDE